MKKLLALLLPACLFSQTTFRKYFGKGSTYEKFERVISLDDGGLVAAGITGVTNGNGLEIGGRSISKLWLKQ